MADLGGDELDGGADRGTGVQVLGVASRAMTCVAGVGESPSAAHTYSSTAGSMFE